MFQFGNVVVVDKDKIGVIVKSWEDGACDIYVRAYNTVVNYKGVDIKHFIYSKELTEEEVGFYATSHSSH